MKVESPFEGLRDAPFAPEFRRFSEKFWPTASYTPVAPQIQGVAQQKPHRHTLKASSSNPSQGVTECASR